MKRILTLCCFAMSGCLCGCEVKPMKAEDLFSTTAPKLTIKKSIFGFKAEAGTNFSGSLKADYDPTTGMVHVDGQVNSDVSGVVKSEGDRLVLMELQRRMDIDRTIQQEQIRSMERIELYKTIGSVVPLLAQSMAGARTATNNGSTLLPQDFDAVRYEIDAKLRALGFNPLPGVVP